MGRTLRTVHGADRTGTLVTLAGMQPLRRLLATLVLVLASVGAANGFDAFADTLFTDIHAEATECAAYGIDVTAFDFGRCGLIGDNMVDLNRQIVEFAALWHDLVVTVPWSTRVNNGVAWHMIGYRNSSLVFTVAYVEMGGSSFVAVTASR